MKKFSLTDLLYNAEKREATILGDGYGAQMATGEYAGPAVTEPAPAPKRIGEMAPHPYVSLTQERLTAIHTKYSDELEKLKADITKLTEEHRQLFVSWLAIGAALGALETETVVDTTYDETLPGPNG